MQSFPELDSSLEQVAHLSTYAVSTRYPSDEPEPEVEESRDGLALARTFVAQITDLIDKMKM